jgi:predicted transcriptional regulator
MKEVKRRQKILKIINTYKEVSCAEIHKILVLAQMGIDSNTLSSYLHQMIKQGILKYSEQQTSRGGHIYMIAPQKRTFLLNFNMQKNVSTNNN